MEPLTDGVYAVPQRISRGEQEAVFHPTAVETPRGLLLVDVGFPQALDQLSEHLQDADHALEEVWGVVLTHHDGDHAAGLSALVDRTNPVVFAHSSCAPFVDGRRDPIKSDGDRYPPTTVDVEVEPGSSFLTTAGPMEAVFTPGHAPGHLSLYFPEKRLLLAGDALTVVEDNLAGPNEEYTPNMETAIESVGRLAELDVERTHCYHGGWVDEGTGAIARIWAELSDST